MTPPVFTHWTRYQDYRHRKRRRVAFQAATRDALPLFLRGGDVISVDPWSTGVYEPDIKALLEHQAANGFGDFLIDIGANVGLTSCQSGRAFREVHLFEPNPLVLSILKVNCQLALRGCRYVIHEVGLGSREETLSLHVPASNWGGAFIKGDDNEYDETVLSAKDGFESFDADHYDLQDVKIGSADERLRALFSDLGARELQCGVVKLDVEGYERLIIGSLLNAVPEDMKIAIVFENWKHEMDLSEVVGAASRQITFQRLHDDRRRFANLPRWVNSLVNTVRGGYETRLVATSLPVGIGTHLITVAAR